MSPAPVVTPQPQYALRRQLAELGVPVAWIPEHGDAYRVLDQLIGRLVTPAPLRLEPGQLVVVVGPRAAALEAAQSVCADQRLDASTSVHLVEQRWEASRIAARIRHENIAPAIAVVATDEDGPWVADVVAALRPDTLWLAVDATCKPADLRRQAATLGRVDAISVSGAARTTSPASVWELTAPIALLDGRPATRGTWTALLLDKLAALAAFDQQLDHRDA